MILLSWLLPPFSEIWNFVDIQCAKIFNALFVYSSFWQSFALFWNSRQADWLLDVLMIGLFILAHRKFRLYRKSTLVLVFSLLIVVHVTSFRVFSRRIVPVVMQYKRLSPSLAIPNYTRVKKLRPDIKTKDSSDHCFPGDHALTCSLYTIAMTLLYGRRWGFFAFIVVCPVMFARAFVGAHWISDIMIGSFAMALFYLTLLFHTPVLDFLDNKIQLLIRNPKNVRLSQDK